MSQARVCSNVILCFSQIHIWNYEIPTQLKSTVKQFYRFTKLDYSSNCSLAPVFWQLSDSAASIPSQSIQYFFFFFWKYPFCKYVFSFPRWVLQRPFQLTMQSGGKADIYAFYFQKITFNSFGISFEPILSQRGTKWWPNVPCFWEESKAIVWTSLDPGGDSCQWSRRYPSLAKVLKSVWRATCMPSPLDFHPSQYSTMAATPWSHVL